MGRFGEAIVSIKKAHAIQPSAEILFDLRVMEFLNHLTSRVRIL